ncbi:geminin coiled-coil domain-containing protein 1 [Sigmodon hispidus]
METFGKRMIVSKLYNHYNRILRITPPCRLLGAWHRGSRAAQSPSPAATAPGRLRKLSSHRRRLWPGAAPDTWSFVFFLGPHAALSCQCRCLRSSSDCGLGWEVPEACHLFDSLALNQRAAPPGAPCVTLSSSGLELTSLLLSPVPFKANSGFKKKLSGPSFCSAFFYKMLQDTLVQKEEELARLHEENNHLRQYLNSTLVKCLEEKAKKLLSSDEFSKVYRKLRKEKRKPKEHRHSPPDILQSKTAKRNFSTEFSKYEEQPGPCVDPWVLQTLGLKDLNTIDDTLPANYSAIDSHPRIVPTISSQALHNTVDYATTPRDLHLDYGGNRAITASPVTAIHQQDCHYFPRFSNPPVVMQTFPYCSVDVSPNKTEVAFSTSLSPHCNVKTHSFHQGQAFVRRDEEGGWKFTWVPKQP